MTTIADVLAGTAGWVAVCGDSAEALATIPDASIDSIVTDPPCGIGFMGKAWDGDKGGPDQWVAWLASIMRECLRVLKPGGHALVWSIPRTSHWTGTALELAGFEVRDVVSHWFGSGFPKSLDIAKAIDKGAGHWRGKAGAAKSANGSMSAPNYERTDKGGPITAAAAAAAGWGTALKPACEFWWLVRRPLDGTVAGNWQAWGTGGLNVDACRVQYASDGDRAAAAAAAAQRSCRDQNAGRTTFAAFGDRAPDSLPNFFEKQEMGRWPAHLVLSHGAGCGDTCEPGCVVAELDAQSGVSTSSGGSGAHFSFTQPNGRERTGGDPGKGDSGGASRFFATFKYTAKPATSEKNAGLGSLPARSAGQVTGRKDGSAGLNSPRAGGGRTSGCLEYLYAEASWAREVLAPVLPVDTDMSAPRDTGASEIPTVGLSWSTCWCGSPSTDPYHPAIRSIIGTATSSTTESPTWKSSTRRHTNGCIAAVCAAMASGSSLAECVESSSPWASPTGTSAERDGHSTDDAGLATSVSLWLTSDGAMGGAVRVPSRRNTHPTPKSIELMRWLCRLITPRGGVVLDPFAGSGTTLIAALREGFRAIGIEREAEYVEILKLRVSEDAPLFNRKAVAP